MISILQIEPPVFVIPIEIPKATLVIKTPTKGDYFKLLHNAKTPQLVSDILDHYLLTEAPPFTESTFEGFVNLLTEKLTAYRKANMDYLEVPEKMDFGHTQSKNPFSFPILTGAEHLVYEYTGLDFTQQLDLPLTEFWLLLADAVKQKMSRSEEGQKYLSDAYRDMHKIRTLESNV